MPEPVVVDTGAISALMDRLTRAADELAGLPIAALDALPGSALGSLDGPRRVAAEVRRLGADVTEWVCSARRSIDDLTAADGAGAARLSPP